MKKLLSIILSLTFVLSLASCGSKNKDESTEQTNQTSNQISTQKPDTENKTEENTLSDEELYADTINFTIELENGGIMKGELYPNLAPKTVKNFTQLVKKNFYDGLIFHRVIEGFMIQGGGYDVNMVPKECNSIEGEFDANGFKNPLKHTKGVLSMARTSDPNSASSQFFIMHEAAPHLDGQYAAFGRITEGFDIIDEIATCETGINEYGMPDSPTKPIVIKTITLDK